MEKTILVVKRFQFSTRTPTYNIEKSATSLEEAMKYKIALESLNNDKDYTFVLFNELGQLEYKKYQDIKLKT
jgi:hypothetical protein